MRRQRVFIVGIDGACFNVLQPHLRAGRMPHLSGFLEGGISAELASVCPPVSPPAWASFHTGRRPEKHGVWGFQSYDPRRAVLRFNTSRQIWPMTFWRILSDAGYRVGIVNVPMTFPAPRVNGVVISGFESPSLDADFCYPPELKKRLLDMFPDYYFGPDDRAAYAAEGIGELLELSAREFRQRAEVTVSLHEGQSFDVFMVNFQSLDWVLHQLYPYLAEEWREDLCDAGLLAGTRELMRVLDESLGRVFDVASRCGYDICIMVSDHGFGRQRGIIYCLLYTSPSPRDLSTSRMPSSA